MNKILFLGTWGLVLIALSVPAAEPGPASLAKMIGQPADIASSATSTGPTAQSTRTIRRAGS